MDEADCLHRVTKGEGSVEMDGARGPKRSTSDGISPVWIDIAIEVKPRRITLLCGLHSPS